MNLILEHLYLGSMDSARNDKLLKEKNVSHVLNCTKHNPYFPDSFVYYNCEIIDDPLQTILEHFPKCVEFIEEGIKESAVLVHCQQGVSRSASMVIAYLMKNKNMSLKEAYIFARSKRDQVSPNFGFIKELLEYEKKLYPDKSPSIDYEEFVSNYLKFDHFRLDFFSLKEIKEILKSCNRDVKKMMKKIEEIRDNDADREIRSIEMSGKKESENSWIVF